MCGSDENCRVGVDNFSSLSQISSRAVLIEEGHWLLREAFSRWTTQEQRQQFHAIFDELAGGK
ncbi:MAG: hypothetical protein JWM11_5453, partial [Planctomycetaceae bacterium]|nr:hypothetical protein [Planctomycetaceae bacterium]